MRDDFTQKTKEILRNRVGCKCSNPSCGKATMGAADDEAKYINIGVAAHICAASEGGPRYDVNMTQEERKSYSNGIWLCQSCSKLIDSDVDRYSVEILQQWKKQAEERTKEDLESQRNFDKKEFYFIEDVKQLYIEIFPNGSPEKINPYTLKTMGFKVFSDYILKNSYPSSEAYFKEFLQKSEIIDMDSLDRRLTQNQTFQMVLEELRVNLDLLEIEKNKYISFSAFSTKVPEIMKNDLEKFVAEASNYNQADFFTEFIRYIIDTYGLHFDRYDVPAIINQSGMYYHSETETIYLNKEIYYGEL